ncbi:hypothetical protein AVEN_184892-1 [Araneus ventricosus]|uniref:Uncharacterized protein n=1 Tax=Araneus ventricosus TaxID=182803 RepID=A0A4Y2GD94_ARAVE|nr:hypothetical protein AVEN_184892-1 [Araneus ventricosus]
MKQILTIHFYSCRSFLFQRNVSGSSTAPEAQCCHGGSAVPSQWVLAERPVHRWSSASVRSVRCPLDRGSLYRSPQRLHEHGQCLFGLLLREPQEEKSPSVRLRRLRKSLHKELALESSQKDSYRRETVYVYMGRLHLEVCPIRRADPALQKTHRSKAIQMSIVSAIFFQIGSFVSAHEKTLAEESDLGIRKNLLII